MLQYFFYSLCRSLSAAETICSRWRCILLSNFCLTHSKLVVCATSCEWKVILPLPCLLELNRFVRFSILRKIITNIWCPWKFVISFLITVTCWSRTPACMFWETCPSRKAWLWWCPGDHSKALLRSRLKRNCQNLSHSNMAATKARTL